MIHIKHIYVCFIIRQHVGSKTFQWLLVSVVGHNNSSRYINIKFILTLPDVLTLLKRNNYVQIYVLLSNIIFWCPFSWGTGSGEPCLGTFFQTGLGGWPYLLAPILWIMRVTEYLWFVTLMLSFNETSKSYSRFLHQSPGLLFCFQRPRIHLLRWQLSGQCYALYQKVEKVKIKEKNAFIYKYLAYG